MSNSNSSNKVSVPEAKEAMNRFKHEVASELGVHLKEGYNGDLTSLQAGSIGGEILRRSERKSWTKENQAQSFAGVHEQVAKANCECPICR